MAINLILNGWNAGTDTDYEGSQFGLNPADVVIAGDLLVIAEVWTTLPTDPNLTLTPPSGWGMIASPMDTSAGAIIYYRICDGTELPSDFYFPSWSPIFPGSLYLSNQFRGDNGLQVVSGSVVSVTNQSPLSGSIVGSNASNQLVLACACDSGLVEAPTPYEPQFPYTASGSITSSVFTAIPTQSPPDVFPQLINNTWSNPPVSTTMALAGGFYYLQNSGLSTTIFEVSPFNRNAAGDFDQVRPWAVAMLTVIELPVSPPPPPPPSGSSFSPFRFEVRDCVFEQPPKVSIIDPFDIEPVIPVDDDYIRYYPQWMALHGTATAPPSDSSTFRFFQPTLKNFRKLDKEVVNVGRQLAVLDTPVNLPRKAWHLQSRFTSRDVITIDCIASGVITNVRRESSTFKFMSADDPVFIIGDNGHIAFRNLAQRIVTVSPVNSSATGALSFLTTQYKIPFEHSGMVPDANVLFFFDGLEYRIRAGSNGVDPYQSVIQLTAPFSGAIEFIYQSKTLAPVVTISISGSPAVAPSPIDLWNRFDELGTYCGIVRRKDEDNLIFRKRLYSRFISKPGISNKQTTAHISQDLTLTDVITWDGITTIDLSGSNVFGVKIFDVGGLPQTDYINEQLIPHGSDYSIYSGSKSDWKAGHIVFLNGRVVTKAQYPNLIVSGNIVNFGVSVSGVVTASYEYDNYTVSRTPLHTILTISPVSSNPLSGSYTVMLAKNVILHTPSDPTYQRANLINSNGTPNDFFYNIANQLTRDNPLTFGRARWNKAVWSEQNEQQPITFSLPLPLDIFTTY